jgi:hypothetical protein
METEMASIFTGTLLCRLTKVGIDSAQRLARRSSLKIAIAEKHHKCHPLIARFWIDCQRCDDDARGPEQAAEAMEIA